MLTLFLLKASNNAVTLTRRSLLLWGRNMCAERKKEEAWVGDKSLRLVFRSALLPRPFLTEHVDQAYHVKI